MTEAESKGLSSQLFLDQIAQSQRATVGSNFKLIVQDILNSCLQNKGIAVIRAKEPALQSIISSKTNLSNIFNTDNVPINRTCNVVDFLSYYALDLIALIRPSSDNEQWKILAFISCTVSFHSRDSETAFLGLLIRLSANVPFVVVTEDRDIYKKGSELGITCNKSTKTRRLLESFSDGIYLIKQYQNKDDSRLLEDIQLKHDQLQKKTKAIVFDDPNIPNHTQYCESVRPLDDLVEHLCRWKAEVA